MSMPANGLAASWNHVSSVVCCSLLSVLGWNSASGRYGLAVYGNNVFDNQYVTALGTYGKTVLGTVGARVSDPATWGVEMSVDF